MCANVIQLSELVENAVLQRDCNYDYISELELCRQQIDKEYLFVFNQIETIIKILNSIKNETYKIITVKIISEILTSELETPKMIKELTIIIQELANFQRHHVRSFSAILLTLCTERHAIFSMIFDDEVVEIDCDGIADLSGEEVIILTHIELNERAVIGEGSVISRLMEKGFEITFDYPSKGVIGLTTNQTSQDRIYRLQRLLGRAVKDGVI